jgi:uncharacterized protein (DUF427 family)
MTTTPPQAAMPSATTVTASYAGTVLARSESTVYLEGNHYFPLDTVDQNTLEKSWVRTLCYWKGIARYYHIRVEGRRISNAAWVYPMPSPLARKIKNMVAFDTSTGIRIREETT